MFEARIVLNAALYTIAFAKCFFIYLILNSLLCQGLCSFTPFALHCVLYTLSIATLRFSLDPLYTLDFGSLEGMLRPCTAK